MITENAEEQLAKTAAKDICDNYHVVWMETHDNEFI